MLENFSYKKFFIDFGILVLLISISFLLIIYSVKLSRKSWQSNLKVSVEKVLDEYDANNWTVGKFIPINNKDTKNNKKYETIFSLDDKLGILSQTVLQFIIKTIAIIYAQ